jgi:hypothetical protein
MIIYNVTIKPDWYVHDEWLRWMKEVEIPAMLDTNFFLKSQMVRLLEVNEDDGPTYAVQYYAESMEQFVKFTEIDSEALLRKSINKWGDKIVVFTTLMEVVN